MQGREFHAEVEAHPEWIKLYLNLFGMVQREGDTSRPKWVLGREQRLPARADYIADRVFSERFDEELMDACYDNRGWPREGLED